MKMNRTLAKIIVTLVGLLLYVWLMWIVPLQSDGMSVGGIITFHIFFGLVVLFAAAVDTLMNN